MHRAPLIAPVLLCLAIVSPVLGDDFAKPDVTKGRIDGKTAMMALPVAGVEDVPGAGARYDQILSPAGCEAHLAPSEDLEHEELFPCGKWFKPREGRYRIWLEAPAMISEGFGMLIWEDEPFRGQGLLMAMGLEPAGRIALAGTVPLPATSSFRVVHLRAVRHGNLQRAFDRRMTEQLARSGASIAAGPVLAGIFDRKSGDALALAHPVTVVAGKTVSVAPALPASGSDVMAVLTWPRDPVSGHDEGALVLDVDDKPRSPDVTVAARDRVIAVWYGVAGRQATLRATSKTLTLGNVNVPLRAGKVSTYRGQFTLLPSINGSVHTPKSLPPDVKLVCEVRRGESVLQRVDVVPNRDFTMASLPTEVLDVVLITGAFELSRTVDLTSGASESVVFDLAPLVVSGTVFYGRDPARGAAVAFQADRDWVRAKTDDAGRYEATLWRPDSYVAEVKLDGASEVPFADGPFAVKESRALDFHVPRTHFEVHVTDAATGRPLAGARVTVGSTFTNADGKHQVGQTATTDERGRAVLPPMREGPMSVRAHAEGYLDSEPTRDIVDGIEAQGSYDISLRPVGDKIRVALEDGAGAPVSSGEVWAVRSTSGHEPPLWRGNVAANGTVEIPRDVRDAIFLVRSERLGCAVRMLAADDAGATWTLPPPSALDVRVGKQARLAVWIDGVRVSGVPLAFLTRSVEATDVDGRWSATGLPAQPLRILAWRKASIEAGGYDAVATPVAYPRPAVVDLKPVD